MPSRGGLSFASGNSYHHTRVQEDVPKEMRHQGGTKDAALSKETPENKKNNTEVGQVKNSIEPKANAVLGEGAPPR